MILLGGICAQATIMTTLLQLREAISVSFRLDADDTIIRAKSQPVHWVVLWQQKNFVATGNISSILNRKVARQFSMILMGRDYSERKRVDLDDSPRRLISSAWGMYSGMARTL